LVALVSEMYLSLAQAWTMEPIPGCRDLDVVVDEIRRRAG
jgi:hypothetical protein